jgi:8-oxo-dGTP diphosphatase
VQVAVVHRTKYDDWSLPKGKLEPGEHPVAAAVREVGEETGHAVVLGRPLPDQHYLAFGVPKIVYYWTGRAGRGEFVPGRETDQLDWLPIAAAADRLTQPRDSQLVQQCVAERLDTVALIVLRHAKALPRKAWSGPDLERPLADRGKAQAAQLVPLLGAYGVRRVISSPGLRCIDSVRPYAAQAGAAIETDETITEQAYHKDPLPAHRLASGLARTDVPTVVCTHRPVLDGFLTAVGVTAGAAPPPQPLGTGEMFVFHLADGVVAAVERHAPPVGASD